MNKTIIDVEAFNSAVAEQEKEATIPIIKLKTNNFAATSGEIDASLATPLLSQPLINQNFPLISGNFDPTLQRDFQRTYGTEFIQQGIRTQADTIKKRNAAEIEAELYEKKSEIKARIRAQQDEHRRSITENVTVDDNGRVCITTKDTRIKTYPRELTNMRHPKIITYVNANAADELCFCLSCFVNDTEKKIYLSSAKLDKNNYLQRKFTTAGVIFYGNSPSKKRDAMHSLVALLIACSFETIELPDETGWFEDSNHEFHYIKEDSLTWKKLLKQSR